MDSWKIAAAEVAKDFDSPYSALQLQPPAGWIFTTQSHWHISQPSFFSCLMLFFCSVRLRFCFAPCAKEMRSFILKMNCLLQHSRHTLAFLLPMHFFTLPPLHHPLYVRVKRGGNQGIVAPHQQKPVLLWRIFLSFNIVVKDKGIMFIVLLIKKHFNLNSNLNFKNEIKDNVFGTIYIFWTRILNLKIDFL